MVSVVVPIYRVEKYLRKCVDSLLQQTYKNIEIILVDDGSPDACPEICDELKKTDDRIVVIHKKNGGLSDARNAGIQIANGTYITFIDSDDYVGIHYIETLVKAIEDGKASVSICDYNNVYDDMGMEREESICNIFSNKECIEKIYHPICHGMEFVAWGKLYKTSLFKNNEILYPVGKIHEDEYIVADVMWKAQKIACISSEEYIYTYQRKGSIMNEQQTQSHCDWLEALYLRFQFCSAIESLSELKRETRAVYFRELNHLFLDYKLKSGSTKKQRKTAKYQYKCMDGKSSTEKVNWVLFQISPYLEQRIVQFVRKIK